MNFKRTQSLIVGVVLLLLSTSVQAQTDHENKVVSLQLGDKVVLIPTPTGYEEVTAEFENLKARFAATEPPQNELLLAYLTTSDYTLLKSGKPPALQQYAKIAVVRQTKEVSMSREEFAVVADYLRNNTGKILDPKSPELQKLFQEFGQHVSKELSTDFKTAPTETAVLGTFNDKPNIYSSMITSTLKRELNGKTTFFPVLGTVSILHIKTRMISVATYRGYKSEADVEELKTLTINWTNTILAANK
jgi:hypothetical protein